MANMRQFCYVGEGHGMRWCFEVDLMTYLLVCVLKAPPYIPSDILQSWQEKNHPWLELSDVHRETTDNIRVTVIPFYMGTRVRVCA